MLHGKSLNTNPTLVPSSPEQLSACPNTLLLAFQKAESQCESEFQKAKKKHYCRFKTSQFTESKTCSLQMCCSDVPSE